MGRKTKIENILGTGEKANKHGKKPIALVAIGALLGIGATVGALALYYDGYQQGHMAAIKTQGNPVRASDLELPPPFESQFQDTSLTEKPAYNRRSQAF